MKMSEELHASLLGNTTAIACALAANPSVRFTGPDEVGKIINGVYGTLAGLATAAAPEPEAAAPVVYEPAVTLRKSLAGMPNHIVSMIDGRPYKTLKRHLSGHGLTPEGYRERYGLKRDYPMIAPAYSEVRRVTAKRLGLGVKRK